MACDRRLVSAYGRVSALWLRPVRQLLQSGAVSRARRGRLADTVRRLFQRGDPDGGTPHDPRAPRRPPARPPPSPPFPLPRHPRPPGRAPPPPPIERRRRTPPAP